MAQEVAGETATILSEEDLQRAIELEAWCDWDPAAAARHRGGRVEADTSASIDLGIYSEVKEECKLWVHLLNLLTCQP